MTREVLVYNEEEHIFEKKKIEKLSNINYNIYNSSPNSVKSNKSNKSNVSSPDSINSVHNDFDDNNDMEDINFQDIYIRSLDLKRHKWDLLIKIKNCLLKCLCCFRKTN